MTSRPPPARGNGAVALAAALEAGLHAATEAAQVDKIVHGMDAMAQAAEQLHRKVPEILKGDLFEYIEAAKFNAQAVAKDPSLVASLTREAGNPHSAVDILIERGGAPIQQVQAKAMNETEGLTRTLSDPKYHGMQKVVPIDKADQVQVRAEYRARYWTKRGDEVRAHEHTDTAENVTGEIHAGDVSSGGTTTEELAFAARHPRLYRLRIESKYAAGEAATAAGRAAATGAVVGGVISAVKHGILVAKGELDAGEAAVAVAKETAVSGLRSGATGAAGAVVRYGACRAGVASLAKANVATAVAASLIDIGVTLHDYARGSITGDVAAERIGQTGCSTMSSVYAGAAAGLVFGPAGAVVGSIAGYLVAAQVYQSSLAILRRAQLADEEAARIEAVCADSVEAMVSLRNEIENRVSAVVGGRERAFEECLALVDAGLDETSAQLAIEGLSRLAMVYGTTLRLATFEEFDEFMLGSARLRF